METAHAHGGHGAAHGSLKSYVTGFVLSIILTVAAFWVVMNPQMSQADTLVAIFVLAVVQIVVHVGYFLHLDFSPQKRWDVVSFAFTIMILGLVVAGTIWIMINMMDTLMPSKSLMNGAMPSMQPAPAAPATPVPAAPAMKGGM
jgi:cytochrome o ubiquinol oxidase operon protein cyoD